MGQIQGGVPATLSPGRTSHYCPGAEPRAVLLTFGVAPSGSSAIAVMEWNNPIPLILATVTTLILITLLDRKLNPKKMVWG